MAVEDESKRTKAFYSSENRHSVPTLPKEIIIQILLRLPVECLLRCKSVCKEWYTLISDPYFVNSHLSFTTSHNVNQRLMFIGPRNHLKTCDVYDVMHSKSVNALELDNPIEDFRWFRIVGYCNGLLCLKDSSDVLYIRNPSTRRSNRLPNCGFKQLLDGGFGYDNSSEDYKVVVMAHGSWDGTRVKMYSLKSANWKKIGNFPGHPVNDYGKFLNGALHWVARVVLNSVWSRMIVSLDLATGSYGEVLQPLCDEAYDMRIGALGECLSLVCTYRRDCVDVWMMKVYGDPNSWTKLLSIQSWNEFWGPPTPCFANDGKILLECGTELFLYDVNNGSSSKVNNYRGSRGVKSWTIIESLVSPGGT